jgi:CheY-like chemotaxis protein
MRVVLVLDDEPAVADAMTLLLSVCGYQTLLAACAEEALDRIDELGRAPDLLLCDYLLRKRVNGIDAIRKIRSMTNREVPAILLTGVMSLPIAGAVDRLPRCQRLSKPIDADILLALMERLLEGR